MAAENVNLTHECCPQHMRKRTIIIIRDKKAEEKGKHKIVNMKSIPNAIKLLLGSTVVTINKLHIYNQKVTTVIIIYHDFLHPPRRGSHVKSDNTRTHTHSHQDTLLSPYMSLDFK